MESCVSFGVWDREFVTVSSGCVLVWLMNLSGSVMSTTPFMTLYVTQTLLTFLLLSSFGSSSLATRSGKLVGVHKSWKISPLYHLNVRVEIHLVRVTDC